MTLLIISILFIGILSIIAYFIEVQDRNDERMGKLTKSDLRELVRGGFFSEN